MKLYNLPCLIPWTFQTFIVLSLEAEAILLPSGEKEQNVTYLLI